MHEQYLIELESLFLKKAQVTAFVKENAGFLDPFISPSKGITHIDFSVLDNVPERFYSTSTGFSLYYLSNVLLATDEATIPSSIVHNLQKVLEGYYPSLLKNFLTDHRNKKKTRTGALPNNYNTPLQLVGILSASYFTKKELTTENKIFIEDLIKGPYGFIRKIKENDGFIERVGSEKIPSPYLTFWVVEVLRLYDELYEKKYIDKIYLDVSKWAVNCLSKVISNTYSGIIQSFDAIETSYLLLILLSLQKSKNAKKSDSDSIYTAKKLIEHAIEVMFTKYFSKGCFTKSLPVFSDTTNFSFSCPTIEPISLLLAKHPEYFYNHCGRLSEIYDWLSESKFKFKNTWLWRSEWEHSSSGPTSFMTVCVFTFLAAYQKYLDKLLSKGAENALGVLPYCEDKEFEDIKYPTGLDKIVNDFIIEPIQSGKKDLAHYSMILFGPPGTSKTTISKKIAQDLKWPLLVINANNFLKSGIDKIDFEAERIFKLVSYLDNVVVLFDEVEELVLNRDADEKIQADQRSRLLTTSMLPRINDLRNICRIVFIFATNHLNHIDRAISRTGRFDCVHCVMPPGQDEREAILKSLLTKNRINCHHLIWEVLITYNNFMQTDRFCYADLRDLVKRIIVRFDKDKMTKKGEVEKLVTNEITVGASATIETEDLLSFKEKKDKFDRPR